MIGLLGRRGNKRFQMSEARFKLISDGIPIGFGFLDMELCLPGFFSRVEFGTFTAIWVQVQLNSVAFLSIVVTCNEVFF